MPEHPLTPQQPSMHSRYPPDGDGANTPAPADGAAPPPASATPATAGASTGASAAAGATNSRPSSPKPPTANGKPPAPASAPAGVELPYVLASSARWLSREQGAVEVYALPGGMARLLTAHHDVELDAGHWVLARFPIQPEDLNGHAEPLRVEVAGHPHENLGAGDREIDPGSSTILPPVNWLALLRQLADERAELFSLREASVIRPEAPDSWWLHLRKENAAPVRVNSAFVRALNARAYIHTNGLGGYVITDAGRAALAGH